MYLSFVASYHGLSANLLYGGLQPNRAPRDNAPPPQPKPIEPEHIIDVESRELGNSANSTDHQPSPPAAARIESPDTPLAYAPAGRVDRPPRVIAYRTAPGRHIDVFA